MSSISIDRGTNVTFAASDCEARYHGLRLAPLRWMDDILRIGDSVASAQYSNCLIEELFEQKSLSLKMEKSHFIIMANESARKKMRNQFRPYTPTNTDHNDPH